MITILEPSIQFLGSLVPHFRDFTSIRDSSTVGLLQVEMFLCMLSALLNDHFSRQQRKLKLLGISSMSKSSANSGHCTGQTGCSGGQDDGRSSVSNASDDCNALKYLLVFSYIWGFGSSFLDRC